MSLALAVVLKLLFPRFRVFEFLQPDPKPLSPEMDVLRQAYLHVPFEDTKLGGSFVNQMVKNTNEINVVEYA